MFAAALYAAPLTPLFIFFCPRDYDTAQCRRIAGGMVACACACLYHFVFLPR